MRLYSAHLRRTVCTLLALAAGSLQAEDGYGLWLRYDPVSSPQRLSEYRLRIQEIVIQQKDDLSPVQGQLQESLSKLLGRPIPVVPGRTGKPALVVGTPRTSAAIAALTTQKEMESLGTDGYLIRSSDTDSRSSIIIAANTSRGLLYGAFHLLRVVQTQQPLIGLSVVEKPRFQRRLLNHWDNPDGTVERGYAGRSIWDWDSLPDRPSDRIRDYGRANASIGINGTVLNNVNSRAEVLTEAYLEKAAAIADILRPWGMRVYLSIKCSAPMELDGPATADPLDPTVRQWWKNKTADIYRRIPDFGGFLVKAYSEGQPGPQQYGRTHADGANMLAEAVRPFGGVVMWRAFVYDLSIDPDRTKCAYLEFVPLDGKFAPNAMVQVKNGPVDFQPREPFNPLFGAMPGTPLMLELQITQEYTGQARHLVYLAPQWKEVLDSNTYAYGAKTPVATIIDGTAEGHAVSGIAGVSGIGQDRNWTGHHFSQANWYAFGRLAWNPDLSGDNIADEWIRMTWSNDETVVKTIRRMMSGSWQACVNYMTPMGLHHLMAEGHHYGPQPDYVHPQRHDWSSTYYHRADRFGIGFDRSTSGTGAVAQYHKPLQNRWNSVETCPIEDLLWFHHAAWDYRLSSGRTVWEELQSRYQQGVDYAQSMRMDWRTLENKIDAERYRHVRDRLDVQYENACRWRDVCLGYFGQFAEPAEQ